MRHGKYFINAFRSHLIFNISITRARWARCDWCIPGGIQRPAFLALSLIGTLIVVCWIRRDDRLAGMFARTKPRGATDRRSRCIWNDYRYGALPHSVARIVSSYLRIYEPLSRWRFAHARQPVRPAPSRSPATKINIAEKEAHISIGDVGENREIFLSVMIFRIKK